MERRIEKLKQLDKSNHRPFLGAVALAMMITATLPGIRTFAAEPDKAAAPTPTPFPAELITNPVTKTFYENYRQEEQSRIRAEEDFKRENLVTPTPSPTRKNSKSEQCLPTELSTEGWANWYSRDNCLGCGLERRTASGDILDDSVASLSVLKNWPIPGRYLIENLGNNPEQNWVIARGNDHGSLEENGVVADLGIATRMQIAGEDKTYVRVTLCATPNNP